MDPQLKAQCRQLVRISTSAATANEYGEVPLSTSTTYWARVEENNRLYDRGDGEMVRTTHMVILDNDVATPTYAGWIWLPGASASTLPGDGRHPKIIKPCPGEDGSLDHWEIQV